MRSHLEHALAMNQLLHFPEELERIIGPSAQSYDYGHDENKGMEPVAADIKETAKGYVFYADVPGLTKSDIQVSDGKIQRVRFIKQSFCLVTERGFFSRCLWRRRRCW